MSSSRIHTTLSNTGFESMPSTVSAKEEATKGGALGGADGMAALDQMAAYSVGVVGKRSTAQRTTAEGPFSELAAWRVRIPRSLHRMRLASQKWQRASSSHPLPPKPAEQMQRPLRQTPRPSARAQKLFSEQSPRP